MNTAPDPARRGLLFGRRHARAAPVRPPWTVEARLLDTCRRCDACADACPQAIVVRGDGGFPEIRFAAGSCTFCGACAEACPVPGLFGDRDGRPWELAPVILPGCLNHAGVVCQSCGDCCPERAIRFRPALGGVPRPAIDAGRCCGCGACVAACPAASLEVRPA